MEKYGKNQIPKLNKLKQKFFKNKNYTCFLKEFFNEIFKIINNRNPNQTKIISIKKYKHLNLLLYSIWFIARNPKKQEEKIKYFNLLMNNNNASKEILDLINSYIKNDKKYNPQMNFDNNDFKDFIEFINTILVLIFNKNIENENENYLNFLSKKINNKNYYFNEIIINYKTKYKTIIREISTFLKYMLIFFMKRKNNKFNDFNIYIYEAPDFIIQWENKALGIEISNIGENYKYDNSSECKNNKHKEKKDNHCFDCLKEQIQNKYNKINTYKKNIKKIFSNKKINLNIVFYDYFINFNKQKYNKLINWICKNEKNNSFVKKLKNKKTFHFIYIYFDINI